nr:THAP domain-containing protein 2-like [Rhipicephalus microplus]
MVGSCAAFGCANRVKQTPGITFHVFPKDCELRSAWERAVRREGWTPKKNDVLCSTHFEADCFDRTGQTTRLRAGSIPTKFAAFPAHLQKPEKRKRAPPKSREMPSPQEPVLDEAAEVSPLQTSPPKEWYKQNSFGCANRVKQTPGITFHVFPKDCELRSAWERAVRREGWTPKKNDVLCSTHFEADCFDRTGQTTRLRAGSIPTKFAAFPAHLQKPEKRKRAPPKSREMPSPQEPVLDEAAEVSPLQTSPPKEWYKQKVHESAKEVQQLKKKVKTSHQKKRRLSKRIDASQDLIEQLKEQNLLSEKGLEVFQASFSPDIQQLLKRRRDGKTFETPLGVS